LAPIFSITALAAGIPHLRKQGTATQPIVDGKPFLALARELGNNTEPQGLSQLGCNSLATKPNEFYAAGNGVSVTFTPNTPGPPLAGLATVEDGAFVNGRRVPGRRLSGDDDGRGETWCYRGSTCLRWRWGGLGGSSTKGIQRVTLYRYR
jgi:hypothetical protein